MTTSEFAYRQNDLHRQLTRCINGAGNSRRESILALIAPRMMQRQAAAAIAAGFRELPPPDRDRQGPSAHFEVPVYAGGNTFVEQMMTALARIEPMLAGAYVHGSLATDDEIAYSDFDALVILRQETATDAARLAQACVELNRLRSIMIKYDPLQHHGWFVLTERDLAEHCEAYFPAALFAHARSLLKNRGLIVEARPRDSHREFQSAFDGLSAALQRRIETQHLPADVYDLKSMLSEIMILPALYLQARDGTILYKRDTFDAARPDFETETWQPMLEVSRIREHWPRDAGGSRRWILTNSLRLRRLATRYAAPPVPDELARQLTPALWSGITTLIIAMRQRINATRPAGER